MSFCEISREVIKRSQEMRSQLKILTFLLGFCATTSAMAMPQEEKVLGYGAYQLSSNFNKCIAKEHPNRTFAQHELECLQEELKRVKAELDTTYQGLIALMKKNHWKDRLKKLNAAQKEFDSFVSRVTNTSKDLYGSRMAGFAQLYETIDYIELRRKHLQNLLDYYKG